MDLNWLSIAKAHKGLKAGDFSAEELLKACIAHVEKTGYLNNFITRTDELALGQARAVDAKLAAGEDIAVLAGVPSAMKDLFNTRGVRTTCASNMLRDFVPPYESTPTKRLLENDYVLLGKLNLDEFACGVTTESSAFGPSRNPWNKDYLPGGSSGGSTSAVAAGQVMYSLATDTGGSIRQPSAISGCVGLKPTYGRVSRFGVTAMASSWDTVGAVTRTVEDAALVLQAIAGHDPYDSTTPEVEVPDYTMNLGKGVQGLKIGVPREFFGEGLNPEIREAVMSAIKEYEKMGATVKEVDFPMLKYGVAVYYVTMPGELSTNLARYDGLRFGHKPDVDTSNLMEYLKASRGEGFGDEIKRRIMVGTFVLSAGYADAYYKQALKARTLFIQDFDRLFGEVDVLMGPVTPSTAWKVGEKTNDPLANYMADMYTIPGSTAGIPGISVPCGFDSKGLPIGLQILTPQFTEAKLLQVAAAYEQATEWHKQRPSFHA